MSEPLALVLAADQNNLHNTDRQQRRLALGRTPVEKAGGGRELQTCHDAIHLLRYFLPLYWIISGEMLNIASK